MANQEEVIVLYNSANERGKYFRADASFTTAGAGVDTGRNAKIKAAFEAQRPDSMPGGATSTTPTP